MSYPKDGVVSFSITTGMSLNEGVYNYVPNRDGPVISARQGYLDVSRQATSLSNQTTAFSIAVPKPVTLDGGVIIDFSVSYSTIQPPTQVLLELTSDIVLFYNGTSFSYVYWDGKSYVSLGSSKIQINGAPHRVTLCFSPAAAVIIEDGLFIAKWDRAIAAYVEPIFNWTIQGASSTLHATLSNILIIPPTFSPIVQTPWDISMTSKWSYPSEVFRVTQSTGDPFSITYENDYMRVTTDSAPIKAAEITAGAVADMVKPTGIVTYRMRVNVATGDQSNIIVIGKNILLITDNGKSLVWVEYVNGLYVFLAESSIKTGSGNFTQVTVVYGLQNMTLFEDGVFKYNRYYSVDQEWQANWTVQLTNVGAAISADLGNIRCIPLAMPFPPTGKYNIYNYKFDHRVVTLYKGDPIGPIIGSALDTPADNIQEWNIERLGISPIPTWFALHNLIPSPAYAAALNGVSGGLLFGFPKGEYLALQPLNYLGVWSMADAASSLAVRLPSPDDQLSLYGPNPDEDDQKWQLVRAVDLDEEEPEPCSNDGEQ